MARTYLEDEWIACPILRRCSQHLRRLAVDAQIQFDDMDDATEYESFRSRAAQATGDHGTVCLRGFIAIEKMLELLDSTVLTKYKRNGPKLKDKSWSSLTLVKREVESLMESANLETAEFQLGGAKRFGDIVFGLSVDDFEQFNRSDTVHKIAQAVDHSIATFRPFLRNAEVQIDTVGDDLVTCCRITRGTLAFDLLLVFAHEMLKARL